MKVYNFYLLNESQRLLISLKKYHKINFELLNSEFEELLNTFDNPNTRKFSGAMEKLRADPEQYAELESALKKLIPWRKGPFDLCGVKIDAEWQSFLKWDRLKDYLPELKKKRVLDLGCNNGYYMFKMLEHSPEIVIGMDPSQLCFFQFLALQNFFRAQNVFYLPLGLEKLDIFPGFFHVIFCMGILYHRRAPLETLAQIRKALAKSGTLILETLTYPGSEDIALCPKETYAKMPNVYFIPTIPCLVNWLETAGFKNIQVISTAKTTPEEQRSTPWMPWESLSDFLDPKDQNKTVEGYPAPTRTSVLCNL